MNRQNIVRQTTIRATIAELRHRPLAELQPEVKRAYVHVAAGLWVPRSRHA